MANFQPPPTWANPVVTDEKTGKAAFNPVWLKWFVDLAGVLNSVGAGSGTIDHNGTTNKQGGTANQYYHITERKHTHLTRSDNIKEVSSNYDIDGFTDGTVVTLVSGLLVRLPPSTAVSGAQTFGTEYAVELGAFGANTYVDVGLQDGAEAFDLPGNPTTIRLYGQGATARFRAVSGTFWAFTNNPLAATISVAGIGLPTYNTVQHLQNIFHSAGYIAGGSVTSNGDGTAAVTSGQGAIRVADSEVSEVKFFDWAAASSVSLTNSAENWIYIDYNSGSPVVTVSTTEPPNHHVYVKLAAVYRDGTSLHINQTVRFNVNDHAANMVQSSQETMGYQHVSGAAISETGTRNLAITAGAFWYGLNRFTTAALDTSVSGSFTTFYQNGAGGWTEQTGQTQINNTQYDDGTGTLATLSSNRYSNRWIYLATDGDVHTLFGQSQAVSLATIQEEAPPSSIPPKLQTDSFLIGRIIIRESTATFIQIDSAFEVQFTSSGVPNHNDTGGLQGGATSEYYHLAAAEYTGTGTGNFVRANAPTFTGPPRLPGYTVATLPAAGTAGRLAYVTNALAPAYGAAVVGGGAVVTTVFDNGTNWITV